MLRQRTVAERIQTTGIGLHSGSRVTLTIVPADVDTGIVFRRMDLDPPVTLPGQAEFVTGTQMASTLSAAVDGPGKNVKVHTVEHLMSALAGLGIDNAVIELTAGEIPILDGSAGSFIYLLQTAGSVEQRAPKRFVRMLKPVQVTDGDKWARLEPHDGFKLTFEIGFGHPAIDATGQRVEIDFAKTSYVQEIARARTFGFTSDFEKLRAMGLVRGGSLDNAIVMDETKVLNNDGLRYRDEFVKHKALDAIGDLYLIGHPILGAYHAHKSGHGLNNQLVRAVLADRDAWTLATFEKGRTALTSFAKDWVEAG